MEFSFLYLQRNDDNLDVSLTVPQYNNGHPAAPVNANHTRYHDMSDQVNEIMM